MSCLTDEPLWPFPNEELIRRSFVLENGRGRWAKQESSKSLTRYVWEYLGHPLPEELK